MTISAQMPVLVIFITLVLLIMNSLVADGVPQGLGLDPLLFMHGDNTRKRLQALKPLENVHNGLFIFITRLAHTASLCKPVIFTRSTNINKPIKSVGVFRSNFTITHTHH